MSIDGTGITELPNYRSVAPPFPDALGSVQVGAMNIDNNGNIWISETGWFYRMNVPEDFDGEEWERYNYYEDLGNITTIRKLDKTGAEISTVDISGISAGFEWFYISAFNVDDDGNLYLGTNEGIFVLDESGNVLFRINVDDWVDQLIRLNDGSVAFLGWMQDGPRGYGRALRKIDINARDWGEDIELPDNMWGDVFPGGGDYSFIYSQGSNLYGIEEDTGESVRILNWMESNVFMQNMRNISILPDGRILCTNQIWNRHGRDSVVELIFLTKTPYSELPQREVLTMAVLWLNQDIHKQIVDFNRSSQTHRIHVIDYSEFNNEEDGWDAGRIRLSTEIISGRVPDMIDVSSLPFNQYVARGLLVDLYPLIDADPGLNRSDLMEAVFRTSEMDGSLYRIFPSFSVSTIMGNPAVLGPEPGWNMEEFLAVLDANPRADIPMGSWLTKENFFSTAIWLSIDEYVNWATGEVSFDSGGFAQLLELSDRFPEEMSFEDDMGFYISDEETIAQGRQIMSQIWISEFQQFQYQRGMFGGDVVFKGFPTENRNGNSFNINTSIAMTTACTDKDGAWSFMRSILSSDWQIENVEWNLPSNKIAFDTMVARAMEEPEHETWWGNIQIKAMTQAEVNQILEVIESASGVSSYDEALMAIIMEGAQDFFTGRSSAQDAARVVQNRASIYVSEQS